MFCLPLLPTRPLTDLTIYMCLLRSRNCLPFTSTLVHLVFGGSVWLMHILCCVCFILFFFVMYLVCSMLPVFLDCPFLIEAVPITTKVVSSNLVHGEVYSIQHYVIKFVSDWRQVGGFHRVLRFPPPIKLNATI